MAGEGAGEGDEEEGGGEGQAGGGDTPQDRGQTQSQAGGRAEGKEGSHGERYVAHWLQTSVVFCLL